MTALTVERLAGSRLAAVAETPKLASPKIALFQLAEANISRGHIYKNWPTVEKLISRVASLEVLDRIIGSDENPLFDSYVPPIDAKRRLVNSLRSAKIFFGNAFGFFF